jgi:MFS family permease
MVGFGAQATHFTTVVLIPLLLSRYHHKSTIEIGLLLLPGASALALTGILGGSLVNRFGSRRLILGGASLMWCGGLALHIAGAGWAPAGLSLLYVVIAGGYGLLNGPAMSAATAELSPELAGVGVGVYNLLFFLGGAISVALAGGILRSRAGLDPLDPLFSGSASEFSDAALVVVAAGAISVMLAALVGSQRTAPGEVTIPQAGAAAWPLKPRAKPNAPRDV